MAINQQLLDRFNALANERKYKELAEFIIDSASDTPKLAFTDKAASSAIGDTIYEFFASLGQLTEQGEIDPVKKEIVYALSEEFARIRTNAIIDTGKKYKEWQQRIANGELSEITSMVDDPKFPDALAHDMALYKSEEGRKYVNAYNMNGALTNVLQSFPKWNKEIVEPEFKAFGNNIYGDVFDVPFIAGIYEQRKDVTKDEINDIYKKFGLSPQPSTASYHFGIDEDYEYNKDKPVFYEYPKNIREIMDAKTPEELEELRAKHQKMIETADEFGSVSEQLAIDAKIHYDDIDGSGNKRLKKFDEYKKFKDSLNNLTNIGKELKFNKGGTEYTTDEYLPVEICKAAEKTKELCDAYSNKIDNIYKENNAVHSEYYEFIDEVSIDLTHNYIAKLKALAGKLPPSSISSTIENEKKQIEKIDAAIKARGYDSFRMKKAALNTKFGRNISKLDGCIDYCEEAKRNVHNGGKDYDEAVEALHRLSEASKAYKASVSSGGLREENRTAAEELREQAIEAQKKMAVYIQRKKADKARRKNKELDIKGQKRLEAMNDSFDVVNSMIETLDEQIIAIDFDLARNELSAVENAMKNNISDEKNALLAKKNNEQLGKGEGLALNGAVKALDEIEKIANGKGELSDNEKKAAVEAAAKLAFYKIGLYNGVNDNKGYFRAIHKFTEDPIYKAKLAELTGNITRERLLSIAGEKEMKGLINNMHDAIGAISKADLEEDAAKRSAVINASVSSAYLDKIIADAKEPDADKYDEMPVSLNVQAAQAAKRGLEELSDIAQSFMELEDYELDNIKEAYAALAFQSTVKPGDKDKVSYDDYLDQVRRLANDEDFSIAVGNVDRESVIKFLNDDKAPEKLMDSFLSNKKRSMEEGAKNIEKNAQAELDKQIKPKEL